jgi:hypothetical protein
VTVNLPFNNVRWVILNTALMQLQTIGAKVSWASLVDDPFTLNTTLPTW